MPQSRNPKRRAVTIRTFMEIRRAVVHAAQEIGLPYEETVAALAVRLGDLEGRPVDISSVAETTGQKFSSSHRYLRSLRERGMIKGWPEGKRMLHTWVPTTEENPVVTKAYSDVDLAIRRASRALAKLDKSDLR